MVILLIPRSATNLWLCKLFGSKAAFSAFFVLCSKAEQETRNVFNNFTAYRLGKFLLDVAWRYCPLFYFENASEMLGEPRVSSLQIFDCRNFICKNSTERIKKHYKHPPSPQRKIYERHEKSPLEDSVLERAGRSDANWRKIRWSLKG